LFIVPEWSSASWEYDIEHTAIVAGTAQCLYVPVAPFAGPPQIGEASEAEILVSTLQEMFCAKPSDLNIVGPNLWDTWKKICVV
jgi:hypothetical protein